MLDFNKEEKKFRASYPAFKTVFADTPIIRGFPRGSGNSRLISRS